MGLTQGGAPLGSPVPPLCSHLLADSMVPGRPAVHGAKQRLGWATTALQVLLRGGGCPQLGAVKTASDISAPASLKPDMSPCGSRAQAPRTDGSPWGQKRRHTTTSLCLVTPPLAPSASISCSTWLWGAQEPCSLET